MRAKPNNCPCCDRYLDHTSNTKGENVKAKSGDLSVCGYCATMLRFNDKLDLELLTGDQFSALDKDMQEELNNTVYLIVNMHK
jgi:hypothetical protein